MQQTILSSVFQKKAALLQKKMLARIEDEFFWKIADGLKPAHSHNMRLCKHDPAIFESLTNN